MMRSMKREEKKWRPYAGTSYQNYANSAFLLLYSSIPILDVPYISHYPLQICHTCDVMPAMMESAETRSCMSELSSSQESSSTQSVKEILRHRIEQKRVQQIEQRFSGSQHNATLSNWASILSNLGYFCELRSIIAACGKIHGAYCRFDHWTVKSQVHLH